MIQTLKIENFKSFKELKLEFGNLNFIIGSNASGKSNLFDAFRFLQGVGNGFTLPEIINGKPKSATAEVWEPIRGGSSMLAFLGAEHQETRFELSLNESYLKHAFTNQWQLAFDPKQLKIINERFAWFESMLRKTNDPKQKSFGVVHDLGNHTKRAPNYEYLSRKPAISQFREGRKGTKREREKVDQFLTSLSNMQKLDLWPTTLREYSKARFVERMGEHGENFAALIQTLIEDAKTKDAYLTWLQNLRPQEVTDIKVLKGAVGEPLFCLAEGDKEFPAPALSDGTLRFAAIAAALFQPDMPAILTIEEIENGIHANRLRLLVELLRQQAKVTNTQIFVTTHSSIILSWLNEEEYAHTYFCKRDEATGESKICPLTDIPNFQNIVSRQPIGDLFAEGWMEAVL